MHFGNFTDIKLISQGFSDCGLHNDKYTEYSPPENCMFRASIPNPYFLTICDAYPQKCQVKKV